LPLLVFLPRGSMNSLPLLVLFLPRFGIHLSPQKLLLTQQLPPVLEPSGIKRSRIQGRPYCTTRLALVTAIAEPASLG